VSDIKVGDLVEYNHFHDWKGSVGVVISVNGKISKVFWLMTSENRERSQEGYIDMNSNIYLSILTPDISFFS
jgi:hypothetical protein